MEYLKTEYAEGTITFHVKTKQDRLNCGGCGSKEVIRKGRVERQFRTVSIGLKPAFIHARLHRLECKNCGIIRLEEIRFADQKKDILGFARYVVKLLQSMTIEDVGKCLRVSWGTIKQIDKEYL